MALILAESCEMLSTTAQALAKGWTATVALGATGSAWGLPAFTGTNSSHSTVKSLPSNNTNTLTLGFRYKIASNVAGIIAAFRDSGSNQIELRVDVNGDLNVTRSGAAAITGVSATTTHPLAPAATWYYIEIQTIIHPTAGTIKVWVNGTLTSINYSSLNTRSSANSYANQVLISAPGSASTFWHDIYVNDSTGSVNTGNLGDVRVACMRPTSDSSVQWTRSSGASNFDMVDDTTPDDDSTYNSDSTAGHEDAYGLGALPSGAGTVYGVQAVVYARKDDAGARTMKHGVKSSATSAYGSNISLSNTYAYYETRQETDPNGGGAWTVAAVNAAKLLANVVS
jgi:hypothetical protein